MGNEPTISPETDFYDASKFIKKTGDYGNDLYNFTVSRRNEEIKKTNTYKFYFYKNKFKDAFWVLLIISLLMYVLQLYKTTSFMTYVFWFVLGSSGILGCIFVYILVKSIIEGIEIVRITKEINMKRDALTERLK